MKNSTKYLAAVLAAIFLFFSHEATAQYYTLNAYPMCWHTPLGVDSTIYQTQTDASQKTKPDRLYYYNASGNKVTVTGGSIRFGACELPTTDSILVRLNVIVNDMDTVINYLRILAAARNAQVVTELGCLLLSDTTEGCDVSGLMTPLNGLTAGWNSVYLNGELLFGTLANNCNLLAQSLNAPIFGAPGAGSWGCCNDNLVIESLDTSLYWNLQFVSHVTGDTFNTFFLDTAGTDIVNTQKIPVEIIKLVDSTGLITDLRYFSADGQTEYTGQGELSLGACPDDGEAAFWNNVNQQLSVLVEQGACDLSDQAAITSITSNTTYAANTLNSISILPLSGTVTLDTGSGAVTLQTGYEYWFGAEGCHYLQNSFVINITGGTVQVSRYY